MKKSKKNKKYNVNQLIETAIEQLQYSYTPYSGFKVGAALLAKTVRFTLAVILKMQHIHRQTVQKELHFSRR